MEKTNINPDVSMVQLNVVIINQLKDKDKKVYKILYSGIMSVRNSFEYGNTELLKVKGCKTSYNQENYVHKRQNVL